MSFYINIYIYIYIYIFRLDLVCTLELKIHKKHGGYVYLPLALGFQPQIESSILNKSLGVADYSVIDLAQHI